MFYMYCTYLHCTSSFEFKVDILFEVYKNVCYVYTYINQCLTTIGQKTGKYIYFLKEGGSPHYSPKH